MSRKRYSLGRKWRERVTFRHTISALLMLMAMAVHGQTVVPDQQIERFINETEPRYLMGVNSTQESSEGLEEARSATRKLRLLPVTALNDAIHLLTAPGATEIRRVRILAFIQGMYRTHSVPPDVHREVSRALFNEMIIPRERPISFGELWIGLDFLTYFGTPEDMLKLSPLLKSSNPEIKTRAKAVLQQMARARGLPDPTVSTGAPLPTFAGSEDVSKDSNPLLPSPELQSVSMSTPTASPAPIAAQAKGRQSLYGVAGFVLAAAALSVFLRKRRV